MSDDDKSRRREPPDDDEWGYIWDGLHKAHKGWPIVGPIVAIASNWKALLGVGAFVIWINRPEIVAAISTLIGGAP